jgi:hydroxyacid-oxoacid transhydrogenase
MAKDSAFEMATSNIRYGPGVTREVGMDLADLDVRRVMVVADPNLAKLPPVAAVLESLEAEGADVANADPADAG